MKDQIIVMNPSPLPSLMATETKLPKIIQFRSEIFSSEGLILIFQSQIWF